MSEAAAKTRGKKSAPAVQRSPGRESAQASAGVQGGLPGLLQGAGPALGLGVQRQVAIGEPGDRFEREAEAAADRVSAGQSVEPAAISPVTPETLAQTAPPAAEPVKQEKMPGASVQRAEPMRGEKTASMGCEGGAEACAEGKQEVKPVQTARATP